MTSIPASDFSLFIGLNSNMFEQKRTFYILKDAILNEFGQIDGYDLQHIKKKCWNCDGDGIFKRYGWFDGKWVIVDRERCRSCIKGVYAEYTVPLQRYILNGGIFHKPVTTATGEYKGKIEGLVRHTTIADFNCTRALDELLDKYGYLLQKPIEYYKHPPVLYLDISCGSIEVEKQDLPF